ncbi:hypothetical protein QTO34_014856 [Cnephaeus nilssonii]|uniref:Uncharacterized protein n=1 Tax=Cnephaeus nilssonii TaxID=3371016 RepID=A0AA40I7E8_CNENI|nr:hypothetical protein QTO34_014856 [Eptesicus nilssonii]
MGGEPTLGLGTLPAGGHRPADPSGSSLRAPFRLGASAHLAASVPPLRVSLTGAVSLGYKFTVTPNGQPWCDIQGQVNGNTFLHYTCGGQRATLTSVPGVSATRAWNQQRDALQDVVEELRKTLLDMKAEMTAAGGELPDPGQRQNRGEGLGVSCVCGNMGSRSHPGDSEPQRTEQDQEIEGSRGLDTSGDKGSVQTKADRFPTVLGTGPLSLQASMTCEQESSGRTSASWELGSDGQTSLRFDSKNGHWTVLRGEGRPLNRTLASDRAMADLLVMTSAGDCSMWLKQVLCPLSTQATATATATVPSKASANRPITSVLPVILTCTVLVGILGWAFT